MEERGLILTSAILFEPRNTQNDKKNRLIFVYLVD